MTAAAMISVPISPISVLDDSAHENANITLCRDHTRALNLIHNDDNDSKGELFLAREDSFTSVLELEEEPLLTKARRVQFAVDQNDQVEVYVHEIPRQEFDSDIHWSRTEMRSMHINAIRSAHILRQGVVAENCVHQLYRADNSCPSSFADVETVDDCENEREQARAAAQDSVAIATLLSQDARGLEELLSDFLPTHRQMTVRAILELQYKLNYLQKHTQEQRADLLRAQSLNFSRQSRDFAYKLAALGDAPQVTAMLRDDTDRESPPQHARGEYEDDDSCHDVDCFSSFLGYA